MGWRWGGGVKTAGSSVVLRAVSSIFVFVCQDAAVVGVGAQLDESDRHQSRVGLAL